MPSEVTAFQGSLPAVAAGQLLGGCDEGRGRRVEQRVGIVGLLRREGARFENGAGHLASCAARPRIDSSVGRSLPYQRRSTRPRDENRRLEQASSKAGRELFVSIARDT